MIKDVLVSIDVGNESNLVAQFAISIALKFKAHITGVAFIYEPTKEFLFKTRLTERFQEQLHFEIEENASSAVARFERAIQGVGLSTASHLVRQQLLQRPETFGRIARYFDLVVLGQQRPNELTGEKEMIQAALFDSGRPIIVVPYIQSRGLTLNRVMVCWDGSRAAARAVADAMPFLGASKAVDVVLVADEPTRSGDIPGFDIAQHLARHGITTQLESIYAAQGDVTAAILNRVQDAAVDLLVMGGYGHSRFREFVLGGVTRGILATMTIPVLLSH